MTFIKKFELNETNVSLHLKGVFCLSKLKINGVDVPKSYFANKIDISQYAKKGENIAEITLFSGNRNFLGPFHYPEEDTFFIAPTFFTLQNTWKDGKSTAENDDYSFERFGLFE